MRLHGCSSRSKSNVSAQTASCISLGHTKTPNPTISATTLSTQANQIVASPADCFALSDCAAACYTTPLVEAVNFRPTMPATISPMQKTRNGDADSPNQTMPIIATPTAPIPVHTA
ncbi:MAG: hypothetical protein ACI8SI_003297 [Congregibacter sp.]|jgi:hypothetical protein